LSTPGCGKTFRLQMSVTTWSAATRLCR
jgi:hypothetical protein